MKDRIEALMAAVQELRSTDIRHPELGVASSFDEAEDSKAQLLAHLERILVSAHELHGALNVSVTESSLGTVEKAINSLRSDVKNVQDAVEAGIHIPEFPKKRASYLKAVTEHLRQFESALHPFETALRVARLETLLGGDTTLSDTRAQLATALGEINRAKTEIDKALSNVRDRVAARSIEDAETGFAKLAMAHARRETAWFWAFLVAATFVLVAVVWAVYTPTPTTNLPEVVAAVFRKLLVITAAAVFLRLALGKYNAERNLRIIYDHRGAVLSQYTLFESAIGDDVDGRVAKNQFRLELAKYIFADPATGYISSDAAADININPMISTIERFGSR